MIRSLSTKPKASSNEAAHNDDDVLDYWTAQLNCRVKVAQDGSLPIQDDDDMLNDYLE